MKISLEWLSAFVAWNESDPHVIADRLTLSTAEVEDVHIAAEFLEHCCVGELSSIEKHPDADRLSIVKVKTDKGEKTVVCGGTNLKEGMFVAFAHVGATVKHGDERMTLQPIKIRGVASEGMICAAEELGLDAMFPPAPEDGARAIIDLSRLSNAKTSRRDVSIGTPLKIALDLTDAVFHVNNTAITIRPDLFSHLGFAREVVALGIAKWKKKPAFTMPKMSTKKGGVKIHIDEPTLVPRYLGCMLEIDAMGETPDWMRARLESVGWRLVNLPVDITNYVASEIGVPMHCFDADDIKGDVHLRLTKKAESIITLDEKERKLPEGVLVLSDDKGIFDLLGIMGGLRSSTKPSSKRLFLHALSIDSPTIRRAITETGHRTDAATVYEKGVPPITTEQGFIRALELFLELVPGATIVSALDSHGSIGKLPTIKLSTDLVRSTLGIDISDSECAKILTNLECDVKNEKRKTNNTLLVTLPAHRLRDLTGPHDLIEEIGRLHGFDQIPAQMPHAPVQMPMRDQRIHMVRDALKEHGFWETVPLSFVSPALQRKTGLSADDAVRVRNPLGEETSLLQTSTLPKLLEQVQYNLPRTELDALRMFSWGHIFHKKESEQTELSVLHTATKATNLLNDPFLVTKQSILDACADAGYALDVLPMRDAPAYAHPGRAASLRYEGKEIGVLCEIHPSVRAQFDLPFRAAAAILNVSALFEQAPKSVMAQTLPAFPSIRYDVTVTRTHNESVGPLLNSLRAGHKLLEDVQVQDLYQGKPLAAHQYNLTLRFTYRAPDRTLTEDEAKKVHDGVLASAGLK